MSSTTAAAAGDDHDVSRATANGSKRNDSGGADVKDASEAKIDSPPPPRPLLRPPSTSKDAGSVSLAPRLSRMGLGSGGGNSLPSPLNSPRKSATTGTGCISSQPESIIQFESPQPDDSFLISPYSLWFSRKASGGGPATADQYDKNLQLLATYRTVEQFWALYSHLLRPGDFCFLGDYHLFKTGIRPMWEDEANKYGGKWIVRLKKGIVSRVWEDIQLALLGDQVCPSEEICGAVVSVRMNEDILALWNRNATDRNVRDQLGEDLRRLLSFPTDTVMEYKQHMDSLKDHSSYRYTDVFVHR